MLRNIGEMKHRITIQRNKPNGESDAKGYPKENWVDIYSIWAHREDISGKEFFGAAAENMEEIVTFTIHWKKGLDNSMRILHKGDVFEIIHISGGRNVGDFLNIRTKCVQKEASELDKKEDSDGET